LPGTGALAYYEKSYLKAVKSFLTFAPALLPPLRPSLPDILPPLRLDEVAEVVPGFEGLGARRFRRETGKTLLGFRCSRRRRR
jgi:hypothetical protein